MVDMVVEKSQNTPGLFSLMERQMINKINKSWAMSEGKSAGETKHKKKNRECCGEGKQPFKVCGRGSPPCKRNIEP
jgi:hypothetical protein